MPNEHNVPVSKPKEIARTLIVEGPLATNKKQKIEKPRLYNSEYLKSGFTFAVGESNLRPQCSFVETFLQMMVWYQTN